jgi:FKBP-type peptidyl-prolyl cis-trans isomerase FkpA
MNIKHCLIALSGIALLGSAKAQDIQYLSTPKGIRYHIYTPGSGPKLKAGDVATFNFVQKTDKDSILMSSYKANTPVKVPVQPSQNIGDMMDLFPLLAAGDSLIAKVPTDSLFKGHDEARPPFFPKGSNLVFVMKILKIQSYEEAMAERTAEAAKVKALEATSAQKYITDNKLTPIATASGLKYVITKPSIKRKPLNGDTVYVNYTGKTLDGKVFDSSVETVAKAAGLQQAGRKYDPIDLVLGAHRVIPGWEEGLLLLNDGAKATFIIPSALAYGERGGGEAIPPFSTLVFDVELVKVKPAKHLTKSVIKRKSSSKITSKKTTSVKKR